MDKSYCKSFRKLLTFVFIPATCYCAFHHIIKDETQTSVLYLILLFVVIGCDDLRDILKIMERQDHEREN